MYRRNKNRKLYQVGTLCQSQEFIPQAIRDFFNVIFMFIKIDFYTELFALELSSQLIVGVNNLAIS